MDRKLPTMDVNRRRHHAFIISRKICPPNILHHDLKIFEVDFGLIAGVEAEDPIRLSIRSVLFIGLIYYCDQITEMVLAPASIDT